MLDNLCSVNSNFITIKDKVISKAREHNYVHGFLIIIFFRINLNKLCIKYHPNPKSRKIDAFGQNFFTEDQPTRQLSENLAVKVREIQIHELFIHCYRK